MALLMWIVLGLVAGFLASKIVDKAGQGVVLDVVLGVVGAVIGGWLFTTFGMEGATGFNPYSPFVAVVGAIFLLVLRDAYARGSR
jgi:uncharacterized membrane protein YeaQ/YmgE (transglycosylase-associated protein family)